MTRHYPDLGSTSDWLKRAGTSFQPIRSTTKIWVVTRHQYGISALVTQTSFYEGSSGDLAKRRLFSQAKFFPVKKLLACKAGGFAGGMIRKQRLRTTGRHFERANKGETGERKKEKGRGWGRGKRREEGGGGSGGGKNRLPGN